VIQLKGPRADTSTLDNLYADELDLIEIAMALEDEFEIVLPELQFHHTIKDVIELVENVLVLDLLDVPYTKEELLR
jgi:acyl carrier protein